MMLTQARLKELLHYDPATGDLLWKVGRRRGCVAGHKGYDCKSGYPKAVEIEIDGRPFQAHRIIWAMHHGAWPTKIVDHKNGSPFDNRIENLRLATHQQNSANSRVQKNNQSSGVKGVYWNKGCKRWVAMIRVGNKLTYLGLFDDVPSAQEAYMTAAKRHFGEFARAG